MTAEKTRSNEDLDPSYAGYFRNAKWGIPSLTERDKEYQNYFIQIVNEGSALGSDCKKIASIGNSALYLTPEKTDEPVLSIRTGIGVDGCARAEMTIPSAAPVDRIEERHGAIYSEELESCRKPKKPHEIRVAIIDSDFSFERDPNRGEEILAQRSKGRCTPIINVGLKRHPEVQFPVFNTGHGVDMASLVLHIAPNCQVGLFRIPRDDDDDVSTYLASTDIAIAIATAVEEWKADVILIAMANGLWGTPRHLREILKNAAMFGRNGKGVIIFCSVGDPEGINLSTEKSACLGADDLASQPWVNAVAASDAFGRWYRRYAKASPRGTAYSRLGPNVAFSSFAEGEEYLEIGKCDDSSQATAFAAATAACVLHSNPTLYANEVSKIMKISAERPTVVDDGAGLASEDFNDFDRYGHNFKIGYGTINPDWAVSGATDPICYALLSTREYPDPLKGGKKKAVRMMIEWEYYLEENASNNQLIKTYLKIRPYLVHLILLSDGIKEGLFWFARHIRAAHISKVITWRYQGHEALLGRLEHLAFHLCQVLKKPLTDRIPIAEMEVIESLLSDLEAFVESKNAKNKINKFVEEKLREIFIDS